MVKEKEAEFIRFFNTAQPITIRMHQLELLPGLGKKHMNAIIEARDDKAFENFEDLKTRVKLIPDPEKTIMRRIMLEMEGKEKWRLFVD